MMARNEAARFAVNVRPAQGNSTHDVTSEDTRGAIRCIVAGLVMGA